MMDLSVAGRWAEVMIRAGNNKRGYVLRNVSVVFKRRECELIGQESFFPK
jgi:hypothetical protein